MNVRLQVVLELDGDADPISGALRAGDGSSRPFVGYAELVSELEVVRRPPVQVLNEVGLQGGVGT